MGINLVGSGTEGKTYNLLKRGITASNVRKRAISNNIANINTKNYKKFNVIFEENLNSLSNENVSLKKTRMKHMDVNGSAVGDITVERDKSTSMRNDGNNVDLDLEMANQAANTLKYNALIQQANTKLANTKYVITGGV
ncbi:MAG: flagellar basal body rod protein FlgB [Clostridiaceae bacterium]|nr:flagellar basal body rod protein FlgB [Clostridiaceae bacterium]